MSQRDFSEVSSCSIPSKIPNEKKNEKESTYFRYLTIVFSWGVSYQKMKWLSAKKKIKEEKKIVWFGTKEDKKSFFTELPNDNRFGSVDFFRMQTTDWDMIYVYTKHVHFFRVVFCLLFWCSLREQRDEKAQPRIT